MNVSVGSAAILLSETAKNDHDHTYYSNGLSPFLGNIPTNHRERWTKYIGGKKAIDLVQAASHALIIGCPLNLFVTIHFDEAGLPYEQGFRGQDAIGEWLKRAGDWLALRGIPKTFLWVMENPTEEHPNDDGFIEEKGLHVHLILHCPLKYQEDFKRLARTSWMMKAGMQSAVGRREKAIWFDTVEPETYDYATATPEERAEYMMHLKRLLRYLIKGVNPNDLIRFGGRMAPVAALLKAKGPEPQGIVYGRRVSRSENIGITARKRYAAERAAKVH